MSMRRTLAMAAIATALVGIGVRVAAEPSALARFEWMFDGRVYASARLGNTLFVGGEFRNVIPPSGVLGSLYAVSPSTGAVVPSTIPRHGTSSGGGVLPDGGGGYYLHGNLAIGTGNVVGRVVHIRPDGSVDPLFNSPPQLTGYGGMARVGPSLILGGYYTIDGALRPLVALDPTTGALLPWVPVLPANAEVVRSMVVSNDRLFVTTGQFYGTARYVTAFDGVNGVRVWETDVAGAAGAQSGALVLTGGRLIVALGRLNSLDPATGAIDATWAANQASPAGVVTNLASDGTTVYACGNFTTFAGQPRSGLAAVDVASGALLPWNPQASGTVERVTVSPSGSVFVSGYDFRAGAGSVNGQTRTGGLFEIDSAGAVTPFQLQVTTDSAAVATFSSGAMVISGSTAFAGSIGRQSIAAFDLTTGALLPFSLDIQQPAGAERPSVTKFVAHDQLLHMAGRFTTVQSQARVNSASVDAATGALRPAWSAPGLVVAATGPYHGGWLYVSTRPSDPQYFGPWSPRRLDPVTGTLDPTWLPPALNGEVVVDRDELLFLVYSNGAVVGSLNPVNGQFRELLRTAFYASRLIADGDTLYLLGTDPNTQYGPLELGRTVYAFDRRTGVPVWRPQVTGRIDAAALADGRFMLGGRNVHAAGVERYGLMELSRTGPPTTWDPEFRPLGPYFYAGGAPGGVSHVEAHGDVLVTAGAHSADVSRVAVFDLSGASAPSGLRSRSAGGVVEFAWESPASPPPGGFVLEGAFAPGQTAATLAVGTGTTFATPLSVLGPAFVRVREQGSTEVSNEIVVGCVGPPLPPTALTTAMNGTNLTLAWTAPLDPVTTYQFSAGTASGRADAATTTLPASRTAVSGTVPAGTFFVRVQATNACGTSGPSGEVFMTIGAPDPLPAAPTNVAASVSGSTVSLTWTAPAGPVTGYVLEGGTAPGLANIGALQVGAVTSFAIPGAPRGVYAVRVRAITSAGSGAPSSDVVVVVP